jgi:hypothetical protein
MPRGGRLLLIAGGALAVVAYGAVAGAHLVNEFLLDKRSWHLDADVDGNAMTWASSLATLAAGALALMLARISPVRRRSLTALGGLLAFFAADDAFGIHEDLGTLFTHVGLPNLAGIWFPVYLPLLGFCAFVLWTLDWPGLPVVSMLRLGLLLLCAAIAGEVLTAGPVPGIDREAESWGYELEVALEEAAELAGWIVVASGLAAADLIARRAAAESEPAAALESPPASAAV